MDIQWVKPRDAMKHPTTHGSAATGNNDLAQNADNIKVAKPQFHVCRLL